MREQSLRYSWPRLRIDTSGTPPPRRGHPCEAVVRHPDGEPQAYGWIDTEGEHWLEVVEAAIFRFRPGSDEVVAIPQAGSREAIVDAYRTSVLPLALQVGGFEALHASAVRTAGGVVAFCAFSGTGKSTAAYGMSRRGHAVWADDAVVLDASPGQLITCHPVPFSLHLREETRAFFTLDPSAVDLCAEDGPAKQAAPLRAVFVLQREAKNADGRGLDVQRLALAEALTSLLPHAIRFSLSDPDRKRRSLHSYLDLVGRIPVFRVTFRPQLERLPEVLDRIEAAVLETDE